MTRGFAIALTCLATLVGFTTTTGAETLIDARQRLMRDMQEAQKTLRSAADGSATLDADRVKAEVRRIVEAAETLQNLFPEGTLDDPKSKALPAILAGKADFDARLQDTQRTALMVLFAQPQGQKALAYAFSDMNATCDGCHTRYMQPSK